MTEVHSCSYYCNRTKCIKAQRDELRERLAQPEQEPDYWLGYGLQAHKEKPFEGATPVYTTPPKRKPLTDERIGQIIKDCKITLVNYCSDDKQIEFARAIEAAHGINAQDPMPLFDDWDKDWK
jgi:hypothetical protein